MENNKKQKDDYLRILATLCNEGAEAAISLIHANTSVVFEVDAQNQRLLLHNLCLWMGECEVQHRANIRLVVLEVLRLNPTAAGCIDSEGYVPTHMIAQNADIEIFDEITRINSDTIRARANNGREPAHFAAQSGNYDILSKILSMDHQAAQSLSNDGRLPLHLASFSGEIRCVQLLCKEFPQGACCRVPNGSYLPIHIAAESNRVQAVEFLHSVYPEGLLTFDDHGKTPLITALDAKKAEVSLAMIRLDPLCASSVAPANSQHPGRLPLHNACLMDNLELIERLLEADGSASRKADAEGYLPIHMAAQTGNIHIFRRILQAAQETLRSVALNGRSCLHFAAQQGHEEVTNLIIEMAPELLSVRSISDGIIPLHLASFKGATKIISRMLKYDRSLAATCSLNGWYPLHSFCYGDSYNNDRCLRMLLESYPEAGDHKNVINHTPFDAFLQHCVRPDSPGLWIAVGSVEAYLVRIFLSYCQGLFPDLFRELNYLHRRQALEIHHYLKNNTVFATNNYNSIKHFKLMKKIALFSFDLWRKIVMFL